MATVAELCQQLEGDELFEALDAATYELGEYPGDEDPGIPGPNSFFWVIAAWDEGKLTDDQFAALTE